MTAGLQRDGGLAGYVIVPAAILLDVSDSGLPIDTLGLAQPMSIAVHAVRRSGLKAGQDAVIVGAGGIGAFLTFAAAATGARVLVVDLNEDRLELARRLRRVRDPARGTTPLVDRLDELGLGSRRAVRGQRLGSGSRLGAGGREAGATIVPVGIQKGMSRCRSARGPSGSTRSSARSPTCSRPTCRRPCVCSAPGPTGATSLRRCCRSTGWRSPSRRCSRDGPIRSRH